MPELAISSDKVSYLIEKAQEFDVKDLPADPDSGSNPTDDGEINVLEESGFDPVFSGPILTFASHPGATFANVRIKGPLASYFC